VNEHRPTCVKSSYICYSHKRTKMSSVEDFCIQRSQPSEGIFASVYVPSPPAPPPVTAAPAPAPAPALLNQPAWVQNFSAQILSNAQRQADKFRMVPPGGVFTTTHPTHPVVIQAPPPLLPPPPPPPPLPLPPPQLAPPSPEPAVEAVEPTTKPEPVKHQRPKRACVGKGVKRLINDC